MSVAGLKKQFHKASQFVSEKVGGAEGTKLDDDFLEMEKKIDTTQKAVVDIVTKTQEYLQPNPASRAKLGMLNTMSKIRGQVKSTGYPQPEGTLGECMVKYGQDLGEESNFGQALVDVGESYKEMAEVKDGLDIGVKQNFIDPLQGLQEKELREIGQHLKKLEGRRLDFDYKKKRQGKILEEDIRQSAEKFEESKEVAESSMFNLLESDVEQVSQLAALVEAQLEYHQQSAVILVQLHQKLQRRISETSDRPRREFKPKPVFAPCDLQESSQQNGGVSAASYASSSARSSKSSDSSPRLSQSGNFSWSQEIQTLAAAPMDQPCCKALFDFDPENDGELGFKEGDVITLTNQIDDNWYEGMIHGQSGFFPINYVEVLVPLPQ
ncbi:endophilin-A3-like isoform X1 [Petromyzon marinus]|uniref:Endophilin-A3-like isoform X1 n=3 Tax=Petromyzon marinus TaxID=7757 RepID=A0AAJ7X8F3_PETMA|nr:endophilin-A3-like isoform X1 [Petromyzon marinus]